MYDEEPTEYVTFERFEARALEMLKDGKYAPDSEETLLAAFRVSREDFEPFIRSATQRLGPEKQLVSERFWFGQLVELRSASVVVRCRCLTRKTRERLMPNVCSKCSLRMARRALAFVRRRWNVSGFPVGKLRVSQRAGKPQPRGSDGYEYVLQGLWSWQRTQLGRQSLTRTMWQSWSRVSNRPRLKGSSSASSLLCAVFFAAALGYRLEAAAWRVEDDAFSAALGRCSPRKVVAGGTAEAHPPGCELHSQGAGGDSLALVAEVGCDEPNPAKMELAPSARRLT